MNPSSMEKKTRISARRVDAPIAKTSFLFIANFLWNNAMIPNTSVNWAKVDPREVPIVIFPCPKDDEIIEFIISGKSVPSDTSTKPIKIGGTFQLQASAVEYSTVLLLENVRRATPTPRNKTGATKSIIPKNSLI